MKTKIFYENDKTISIILNDDDCVIIEIYRFFPSTLTVCFDFIDYDFYYIVDKYKNNLLTF